MWEAKSLFQKNMSKGKKLYIWGTGKQCRLLEYTFQNQPTHIVAIIDDEVLDKWNIYLNKYPIISSAEFWEDKEPKFVILTREEKQFIDMLEEHGLKETEDFIKFSDLLSYGFNEGQNGQCDPPLINQMDVKITYACNFRCEYCYQADENGNHEGRFLSKENAENLVRFVEKLNDQFYITLAGGEPFVYPYLQYLVRELSRLGNHISIVTNFSAPFEKIRELILAAREKLATFNLSVHLSQWENMQDFYDKLQMLLDLIKKEEIPLTIRTTCVLTEQNFEKLLEADKVFREKFQDVPFEIQRVYYNNVYQIYNDQIEEFMKERGLDVPIEEANSIDFYGKKCWTGSKFFYIEVDGEVRRCYTNQFNADTWKLGNLSEYDKIRILDGPKPCMSIHGGNCVCFGNFVNLKLVTDCISGKDEINKFYQGK